MNMYSSPPHNPVNISTLELNLKERENQNFPKHQGHIFYSIKNIIRKLYTLQTHNTRGIMAMKNCFQVSTMCSTRAGLVQCYQPFSSIEKLHLPTCKGLNNKSNNLSLTSSVAHSLTSRSRNRNALILCKAREAVDEVQVVTDSSWESLVIGSESPVLVEFWAPWCGPCRMIAPVMDELAKEYAGKIYCFKLNTDDCPNIATQYGIRSIPTVLFFKNGEKKESVIGAVPKSTLSATIEKYLEN